MKIWYVSKYAATPKINDFSRQYMISSQLAKEGNKVTLIYSRSNGGKSRRFWRLSEVYYSNDLKCVELNGPLIQFGFNFKRIFSWFLFEFNLFIKFFFISKKNRPDCIIASSLSLLTFITAILLKRKFNCKLIVEVRDIWPETIVATGRFSKRNLLIKFLYWVELKGYLNADGIISTLPRFDVYLKKKICKPFHFCYIPQGFDKQFVPQWKVVPFPQKGNVFRICYAGTIGKVNYIEDLLEAAVLLKQYDKIRFVIIGEGPLKSSFIETYGNLPNIEFWNAVPKKDVITLLSGFDLLVNMCGDMSIYEYGVSPNKWIDYMLAGVPILVSYNGFRCIINDAECGFFVKANAPSVLADKILDIVKMPSCELIKMGMNGREYALKNLDYQILTRKILDFIEII